MIRLFLIVSVAVAILAPGMARAHDFPAERSLLVQVSNDRVEMMLVYQEPPGPRTDLLMAKFDLNNDGALTDGELKLAEGELSRRAFDGLRLEVEGERAGMHPPDMKVTRNRDGGLAAAFYLKYELDDAVLQRIFVVRLIGRADSVLPLTLIVEAGDQLAIDESDSPIDGIATKSVEIRAPAEHRTIFRVEESGASSGPRQKK